MNERELKERGCIGWSGGVSSATARGGCSGVDVRRCWAERGVCAARRSISSMLEGAGEGVLLALLLLSFASGTVSSDVVAGECWGRTKDVRSGWSSGKMQDGSEQSRMRLSAPIRHAASALPHRGHVCGATAVSSSADPPGDAPTWGSMQTLSSGSIALSP